ncbi:hypothetical protein GUJ93_ZPchr0012g20465 [Zizania palustris]|uniref:Uncharacterized protein n=1 Tax=Zizania palustris TaxID=103762 RepID=A0A8J5WNI8_ZIZPA|nr:hypothetical protein GUJ93_ZPchr0012g20465 [Zizania palustris]
MAPGEEIRLSRAAAGSRSNGLAAQPRITTERGWEHRLAETGKEVGSTRFFKDAADAINQASPSPLPPPPLLLRALAARLVLRLRVSTRQGREEREREDEVLLRVSPNRLFLPLLPVRPPPRRASVVGASARSSLLRKLLISETKKREGPIPSHKCDKSCQNEHVFGNMYRCKLTGVTHICDKNCNQRILYDNHSSLCRVSGQLFPLSPLEQQAVRGIRRKHEVDSNEGCSFKRRRGAQLHPSPFERSYTAVSPIPSQQNLIASHDEQHAFQIMTHKTRSLILAFLRNKSEPSAALHFWFLLKHKHKRTLLSMHINYSDDQIYTCATAKEPVDDLHLPNVILTERGATTRAFPVADLEVPLYTWRAE